MGDMPRVVGGSCLLKGGARETNTTNEMTSTHNLVHVVCVYMHFDQSIHVLLFVVKS